MPDIGNVVAVLARFVQVSGACLVTGIFAFLVFVGRPATRASGSASREAFEALDRRLLGLAVVILAVTIGAGLVDLSRQAWVARGIGSEEPFGPQIFGTLLSETRFGSVWLVRHLIWLLLLGLLLLRGPEQGPPDWFALRLAGLVLAAVGLAAGAASGHAASAARRPDLAIAVDVLHLLAAGMWAGALVPLILFLRGIRPGRLDALPAKAAVVAVHRFSTLGLSAVAVLVASGVYSLVQQVTSVPALIGTTYGHWLLVKLVLLVPLLCVACVNRTQLKPRLEKAAAEFEGNATQAGAIAARLSRLVLLEAVLVTVILGVVGILGLTTPGRHDAITWPLPFRLVWEAVQDLPNVQRRVSIGGSVAALGLAGALIAVIFRRRWWRLVAIGASAALGIGLLIALTPLAMDAYPTTYVRPTVAYTAASIVRGRDLYRDHCMSCHGEGGAGDGSGASITPRPGDLTGRRIADHTAGDLFWWLTHGVSGTSGHGFGDHLSSEQRWDIVNFVRTLSAAEDARGLATRASDRATIVAPDVSYTTGVGGERSLRAYSRGVVLLVLFRLPDSLERLSRLGRRYFDFRLTGAEIVAVPLHEVSGIYRTLGPRPILFPVMVEGATEAAATYGLFRSNLARNQRDDHPIPHMELLIDRQRYLRARWTPSSPDAPDGWNDLNVLLKEIARLAEEPALAPTPGEHIH
jgi:putative copper resistance protein D